MCDWLRSKFEVPTRYAYSKEEKLKILDRLMWSDNFERFVAGKYPSEKRFGLEGCETLIPGMKAMVKKKQKQNGGMGGRGNGEEGWMDANEEKQEHCKVAVKRTNVTLNLRFLFLFPLPRTIHPLQSLSLSLYVFLNLLSSPRNLIYPSSSIYKD